MLRPSAPHAPPATKDPGEAWRSAVERQEQLEVFSSWEASRGHATHGQALPPGRPEHDRHSRHVRRFMHGARRYPMQFRRIVGREEELG